MSDEDGLVPVPPKEVPEKIEEAFEVEKPNASITVLAPISPATVSFDEAADMVMTALACEYKSVEIAGKKKRQDADEKVTETTIGVTKWMAVGTIG
jgi:hypothetical protein